MSDDFIYPYVTDNNLENVQTYQYAQWRGDDFIRDFCQQRQALLVSLPPGEWPTTSGGMCSTAERLWPAVVSLRNGPLSKVQLDWSLVLLKKFEVSKKLYREYASQAPHKRSSDDYDDAEPYLLLAEVSLRLWQHEKHSYWLSGALKLIDTLCSISDRLPRPQQAVLAALIEYEQTLVSTLMEAASD